MATSKASTEPLFSADLISPEVQSQLPTHYKMRPLQSSDYALGFLDVLRVLTTVGEISEQAWVEQVEYMRRQAGTYYILVIVATEVEGKERVVGCGSLIAERKFIHSLGSVGHIEDIAVAKDQQGKKLGLRIIQALDFMASKVGCYKSILDCSEVNEGFYHKCGYKRAGLEMGHYYEH